VIVIVDQLGSGMLEAIQPQLAGGFARFLDDGLRFPQCEHDHASSVTGPGHATLATGMHPSRHGIIWNEWHDRARRKDVSSPSAPQEDSTANFDGSAAVTGGYMQGETLGDLLKRADPNSQVFAVSLKDRSAALSAGRHADGVFWFNARSGGFTSNPALMPRLPGWGREFWEGDPFEMSFAGVRLPRAWAYPIRPGARPDDDPFESDALSRVSPHPIASARALRASPWADWLTLMLARQIMASGHLGADAHTDLLVIALSATDYIGHEYGPGSQEHLDQLMRLDGWLEELMEAADAAAAGGGGRAIFALTSDHGVLPLPERVAGGRRIDDGDLERRLRAAAVRALGEGDWIQAIVGPHLYLDHGKLEQAGISIAAAARRVRDEIARLADVARVYDAADLATQVPGDEHQRLQRNAWRPDRGGDLVIQECELCLVTDDPTGTSHGTVYAYDRRVPLIIMGERIAAGESAQPCRTVDLAPTLAAVLALPRFESPRDGRALTLRGVDTPDQPK